MIHHNIKFNKSYKLYIKNIELTSLNNDFWRSFERH